MRLLLRGINMEILDIICHVLLNIGEIQAQAKRESQNVFGGKKIALEPVVPYITITKRVIFCVHTHAE